jgi:hypothetical protein
LDSVEVTDDPKVKQKLILRELRVELFLSHLTVFSGPKGKV